MLSLESISCAAICPNVPGPESRLWNRGHVAHKEILADKFSLSSTGRVDRSRK